MKLKIGIVSFGIMLLALLVSSLQSTSESPSASGEGSSSQAVETTKSKPTAKQSTTDKKDEQSQVDSEIQKKSGNYYKYLSALFDLYEEDTDPAFEKLNSLVQSNPDNLSYKLMLAKAYSIKDFNNKARNSAADFESGML